MREPRSIASDLRGWTVIRGPASEYGIDQEDRYWPLSNSAEGVVVAWRAKAGVSVSLISDTIASASSSQTSDRRWDMQRHANVNHGKSRRVYGVRQLEPRSPHVDAARDKSLECREQVSD